MISRDIPSDFEFLDLCFGGLFAIKHIFTNTKFLFSHKIQGLKSNFYLFTRVVHIRLPPPHIVGPTCPPWLESTPSFFEPTRPLNLFAPPPLERCPSNLSSQPGPPGPGQQKWGEMGKWGTGRLVSAVDFPRWHLMTI